MTYVLMGVVVLLYTAQSFLTRLFSAEYPGDPRHASPVFSTVSGATVVVVSLFMCSFHFVASPLTWLLGIFNGFALLLYNTTIIKASQTGPYSVLMVFSIAGGIIIPTITGAIAFGDTLTPLAIICILVVLVCVYLISDKGSHTEKKPGFWLAVSLLAIGNGAFGSLLDVQQRLTAVEQKEEMVAITFGVCSICSLAMLLLKQKKNFPAVIRQSRRSLALLAVASLVVAGSIHILTIVIGMINLAVLYTFYNSAVLMLSVLCSYLFLGEKLSLKNIIGCITMCVALVFMMGGDTILAALR